MRYLILLILFLSSCNSVSKYRNEEYKGVIIHNKGERVGNVTYKQGSQGVLINLLVNALPPGRHGMHFHEVGNCSDHEHFKNSKGHIIGNNKPHGFLHEKGPHEGNLPNLIVNRNGRVELELYTELVSLYPESGKLSLLDDNGSALIIHQNEDDHITQPIGGSGPRIACGVIVR